MRAVIDSHVHVWDPRRFDYPWLAGLPGLDRPMLPQDVDTGGGRAVGAVFVQADCTPAGAIDEARWVAGLDWPGLRGIVAAARVDDAAALAGHLDALAEVPGVVGVRHLLQGEPDAVVTGRPLRRGLSMLAERGLTFDACVRHGQLAALATLLRAVPDARVVLDHLGKPPVDAGIDSEAGRNWAANIDAVAAIDGVAVKVSGLAAEAGGTDALERNAGPFIRHAVEAFGAERAMLGSDWPVSTTMGAGGSFSDWIDRVHAATGASTAERSALEATSAQSFYGLHGAA